MRDCRLLRRFLLLGASSLGAQTVATPDLTTFTPIAGNWSYGPASDGSEAIFVNESGFPQLWVHCTRSTRRISISRPSSTAAAAVNLWTSSASRSVADRASILQPTIVSPSSLAITTRFSDAIACTAGVAWDSRSKAVRRLWCQPGQKLRG